MKKFFALLLALSMIFALAACGGAKTPAGNWVGTINFAELVGEEIPEDYEMFKNLNLDVILELKSDNTFSLAIDGEKAMPAMREAMAAFLNTMLEQQGLTAEDFEAMSGQTVDALIDEGMKELDFTEMSTTGTYTEEKGALVLTEKNGTEYKGSWEKDTLSLDFNGTTVNFTHK